MKVDMPLNKETKQEKLVFVISFLVAFGNLFHAHIQI